MVPFQIYCAFLNFQKKNFLIKSSILNNFYSYLFGHFFAFQIFFRVIATYFYKGRVINLAYSILDGSTYPFFTLLRVHLKIHLHKFGIFYLRRKHLSLFYFAQSTFKNTLTFFLAKYLCTWHTFFHENWNPTYVNHQKYVFLLKLLFIELRTCS